MGGDILQRKERGHFTTHLRGNGLEAGPNNNIRRSQYRDRDMQYHNKQAALASNERLVFVANCPGHLSVYQIVWAPGLENLAGYFTKHFPAAQHRAVRPFYFHMENLPRILRKLNQTVSSRLRGCVDSPPNLVPQRRAPLVWLPS